MSDRPGSMGGGDPYGGWQPALSNEQEMKAHKKRRARNGVLLLAGIAIVAFAAGWNPPTGTVHSFSRASDYNSERESGCVNSGKGCHGSESSYSDFNTYHPGAKCTTCHDYQGVGCIPCHSDSKNHECETCHDGTVEGVVDRMRITDPYPRGHYRETTHTAMGTDFKVAISAAENGGASATCRDCHSRDLRAAHTDVKPIADSKYGTTVGCGECHNDLRTHAQAQVLDKWKQRDCESCHFAKSSSPMHATRIAEKVEAKSKSGCGDSGAGCHEVNDLHALHADAPKDCSGAAAKSEPICHKLKAEAVVPTSTACGGTGDAVCHRGYTNSTLSHKKAAAAHSPKTTTPAEDTSFYGTACGDCHRMATDGKSLIAEHDLATSAKTLKPGDGCRNCHAADASQDAIANKWEARDTTEACSACHGLADLPDAHQGDFEKLHAAGKGSAGCASTGAGCHPTSDLAQVGTPTITANIHRDCLRCHDWTKNDGNLACDPTKNSCGSGRDCHSSKGSYEPSSSVHAGSGRKVDGNDTLHTASARQSDAVYVDSVSGVKTACSMCHAMKLTTEHGRVSSVLATGTGGNLCTRCHDRRTATSQVVKASWPKRATASACESCHVVGTPTAMHSNVNSAHKAVERAPDGTPTPGYCSRPDCHGTNDVRIIHKNVGCTGHRCHENVGDIVIKRGMSCGGNNRDLACHTGRSANDHRVSHSADLTGTVNGITYTVGANNGCFGCHADDLRSEHSTALAGSSMESKPVNTCRTCHDGPGAGAYASLPAVKAAIANHDHRCIACHKSGTDTDGPTAVASPHKAMSTDATLPAGRVWADPFDEWKTAMEATTGGGHNVLSAATVGASKSKSFPVTQFDINGTTYGWALPPNTGSTAWLKASVFGTSSVDTTAGIQHITITCSDCHYFPDGAAGPQGAAAEVRIDPAYSQTEYANPSFGKFQFNSTGTDRVICYKCHSIYQGANEGTLTVGGNVLHNSHRGHTRYDPNTNPQYYGDKCIDCHTRIPHAWKRPRLLVRTIVTTDGVAPDTFPYVAAGTRKGLLGVKLLDYSNPKALTRASCVTGGCYSSHSTTSHPLPAEAPDASYWP